MFLISISGVIGLIGLGGLSGLPVIGLVGRTGLVANDVLVYPDFTIQIQLEHTVLLGEQAPTLPLVHPPLLPLKAQHAAFVAVIILLPLGAVH